MHVPPRLSVLMVAITRAFLLFFTTNHFLLGILQATPIHFRGASVAPVHVGLCGLVSLKFVGLSSREQIRCCYRFSTLYTCAARSTFFPSAVFSA